MEQNVSVSDWVEIKCEIRKRTKVLTLHLLPNNFYLITKSRLALLATGQVNKPETKYWGKESWLLRKLED